MPRTSGVSFSSVVRPILLSLRPISVARCEWWRRIALWVCSTLIVFAALAIVLNSRSSLVGHDLFGKTVSVFPDHALFIQPPLRRRRRPGGADPWIWRRAATDRGKS